MKIHNARILSLVGLVAAGGVLLTATVVNAILQQGYRVVTGTVIAKSD